MCLCTWHSHRDLWWVFLIAHYLTSSSFGFLVALSVSWSALPHLSATPKSSLLFQTQAENRREEQFLQKPKRKRHHRTSRAHCTYTERKQQHPCTVLLKHCPKLHRLWCLSFWFGGLVHFKKCIVCLHAHHSTRVGIRTCRSLLLPSTTWLLEIELRSLYLVTSAFTQWAILPAQPFVTGEEIVGYNPRCHTSILRSSLIF